VNGASVELARFAGAMNARLPESNFGLRSKAAVRNQ